MEMRIIVLSRNPSLYSTQSLVRACYRRQHRVRVVDHLACDLIINDRSLDVLYEGERIGNVDAIIPRVSSSVTQVGTTVIRHFESNGVYSLCGAEAVLRTKDKFRSLQHLASGGVRVPKTLMNNSLWFDRDWVSSQFDLPAVLKLMEGTHGQGVILSESIRNLQTTVESFQAAKFRAMIQEFIKESAGEDIRVLVVGGRVIASMLRQAQEGEFRSNLHAGGRGSRVALTEEEKEQAILATKIMGLDVAGVDLLRSSKGSYVLEVNASPGLEGIERTTGINIAEAIVRYLEKQVRKHKRS